MLQLLTSFLLLLTTACWAQEQIYRVTAQPRLHLREQPDLGAPILGKASYGERVLAYRGHFGRTTIQSREGVWKKVRYRGREGYMFSGYLERISPPSHPPPRATRTPRIWALVVGIAQYQHVPSLRYADDDAYLLHSFLKSPEGGALPDGQLRLLVDENATLGKIQSAMRQLAQLVRADDLVLFYFSGHGLPGAFLPTDYDGRRRVLSHELVQEWLADTGARHRLCIADACHSGSFRRVAPWDFDPYYEALETVGAGTAILLSSRAEEASIEVNGLRQGVFSHYLLKGLKGGADRDGDRLVTIGELYDFTARAVRRYTQAHQSPTIQGQFDRQLPLAILRSTP
ncbi:MAG: caspase family protein [Bacteroidota bacterium]